MLERGLERAIGNFTVAAYVEIEAFCIFNLVKQMEAGLVGPGPIWTDAKSFPAQHFHRKVHGLIGGYPCQPFSLSGQRKGAGDPRHLWPYLRNHIQSIKPVWCFFENVPGHLSLGFDTVYQDLQNLGYAVEAGIYSARELGATHERQRLFILAVDNTYSQRQRQGAAGELPAQWRPLHQPEESQVRREISGPGNVLQWPAAPGGVPHLWEENRTVKPGLGCTIDGYNFKEDLLRMLGNGVVEQSAALAFTDLLKKHAHQH